MPNHTRTKPTKTKHPGTQQLRIIGGQWRGRKLPIADVPGLRPTGDRIRETLFNWLMAEIHESHCLDLFAGSGALGLECLSRGASSVSMLEKHPGAAQQLSSHCQLLSKVSKGADSIGTAEVIQTDSIQWLANTPLNQHSINIVFIDPPFDHKLWENCIDALVKSERLASDALIYIEAPRDEVFNTPLNWILHKEKTTGQVCYRLYRNR